MPNPDSPYDNGGVLPPGTSPTVLLHMSNGQVLVPKEQLDAALAENDRLRALNGKLAVDVWETNHERERALARENNTNADKIAAVEQLNQIAAENAELSTRLIDVADALSALCGVEVGGKGVLAAIQRAKDIADWLLAEEKWVTEEVTSEYRVDIDSLRFELQTADRQLRQTLGQVPVDDEAVADMLEALRETGDTWLQIAQQIRHIFSPRIDQATIEAALEAAAITAAPQVADILKTVLGGVSSGPAVSADNS